MQVKSEIRVESGAILAVLSVLALTACGGGASSTPATSVSTANYTPIAAIGTFSIDSKGLQGYQTPATVNSTTYYFFSKGVIPLTAMYGISSLSKYVTPEPTFSSAEYKLTIVGSLIESGTYYPSGTAYSRPHLRVAFGGGITSTTDLAGKFYSSVEGNNSWDNFLSGGKPVILAFADKRVAGTTLSPGAGLSYTRFGAWDVSPYATASMSYTQVFAGMGTPTTAMPSGTFSYTGAVVGFVVDSSGAKHFVEGDVALTFNASTATVDATLTNLITKLPSPSPVQGSFNDLSFSGIVTGNSFSASTITISPKSGSITPTSTSAMTSGSVSASVSGHFYGPSADELSLSFQLGGNDGAGGAVKLIAALAAKQ